MAYAKATDFRGRQAHEKRNELIREGRYTDAIDELILKIIDAKGC